MNTLRKGSKGEDVKKLQRLLGINPDGIFGNDTLEAVKRFQMENGLDADGVVGPRTWAVLTKDELDITYYPIGRHVTKGRGKVWYIVIHYTAGASSVAGSAKKARNVFENREASADFCVDDETIIQVNPDTDRYYCWAVGDGQGKYGITNSNSISIEMCSNLRKGTSAKVPNHSGWYISDETLENTLKLVRYLMKKYNINKDHVVRHYDASRKACPGIIGWNDGLLYNEDGTKTKEKNDSRKWKEFLDRI